MLYDILKYNVLRIVNGSYLSEKITQKVAVAQNDKLYPLLQICQKLLKIVATGVFSTQMIWF